MRIAAAAIVVAGATAFLIYRTRRPADVVPLDLDARPDVDGPAGTPIRPTPAARLPATVTVPREAIGDGDDVTQVAGADFDELRFVIAGMGMDSIVLGSDVRDAVLARPGTYLRFRSEAARSEFLGARFPCPLMAGLPKDDPPGTPLDILAQAIQGAGFETLYRKPLLRIGARQSGVGDSPR